jgi:DNA modification methylase
LTKEFLGSFELNRVYQYDCLEALKHLPENSIDAIVTDPPYELGFMGKKWDSTGISYNVELWKECLRILKPGGHLLAFGGTRTYHRMACAIEDAGFEIRDQLQWIYGSGFPKSTDISKQIDKLLGAERKVIGKRVHPTLKNEPKVKSKAYHVETLDSDKNMESWDITAPATTEAKQWEGWGTGLKPANEPIVMARKPFSEKTIVKNVLKWGTGGINIDDSRIAFAENDDPRIGKGYSHHAKAGLENGSHKDNASGEEQFLHNPKGRFPANVLLDEFAAEMLDQQSGITKSGKVKENKEAYDGISNTGFLRGRTTTENQYGDSGGASRFFYCAKASKSEKGKFNNHPTVKPVKLMEYLVTLVTPPNGIVLDPFVGSGSTLVACKNKNYKYIGFEKESQYIEITNKRLDSDFDEETDEKVLNT